MTASPEAVLEVAMMLHARGDFRGVAALCDPLSAAAFHRRYCEAVRPMTIAEYRHEFPHLPEDALLDHLARHQRLVDQPTTQIARAVPGILGYPELEAMAPMDFVRRWLEGSDPRYEIARRLRELGRPVPPSLYEVPAGVHCEARLDKAIGDTEVRVSYRVIASSDQTVAWHPSGVESLRRISGGEWRLIVRAQMLQPQGGSIHFLPPDIAAMLDL